MHVYPIEEYWRDSKDSYNFYYCKNNPDVCKGNDICEEGHIGLMCENCDRANNYSYESLTNKCKQCDASTFNIIMELLLLFMLAVLFLFN